ncbi:hypothetical protein P3S67_029434 [Capsicum chacoense]
MSALMNDDIFWTSLSSEPSLGPHVRIHLLIPPRVWLTSSVQDLISGKDKLPPKSNKYVCRLLPVAYCILQYHTSG